MPEESKVLVEVTGVHGEHFTISGHGAGTEGVWLDPNHVGLLDTPVSTVWRSAANQVGGDFQAAKFDARDITLPLTILDSESRDWQTADSRWRRAWSYFEDCTITVTTDSGSRSLKARMTGTPEMQLGQLGGHVQGRASVLMTLKAGNPLWESESSTDEWIFDGLNYTGNVTVENPTDMPMWLRWVVTGPASMILPDYSFEDRRGYPGYEHQARQLTLPFQDYRTHVVVDTDPMVEQVVAIQDEPNNIIEQTVEDIQRLVLPEGPQWWARMNGQFFTYPIPPWTPPTKLPVMVNPVPWLPDLWRTFQIPFAVPTEFLAKVSVELTKVLQSVGQDTFLTWSVDRMAQEIDKAIREALAWAGPIWGQTVDWIQGVIKFLTRQTIGNLIAQTWGSVAQMPGAGVQVRMVQQWSRPWGLEEF